MTIFCYALLGLFYRLRIWVKLLDFILSQVKKTFLFTEMLRNLETYLVQLRLTFLSKLLSHSNDIVLFIQLFSHIIDVQFAFLENRFLFDFMFWCLLTIFKPTLILCVNISVYYGLVGLFALYADFWQKVLVRSSGCEDFAFLLVEKQVSTLFNIAIEDNVFEIKLRTRDVAANIFILGMIFRRHVSWFCWWLDGFHWWVSNRNIIEIGFSQYWATINVAVL